MKSKILEIQNSKQALYLGLGLFSDTKDLIRFTEKYNLQQRISLNDKEAKKICNYALHFGLIAEIKKRFK